jgi:TATA-binding protein-associated factor
MHVDNELTFYLDIVQKLDVKALPYIIFLIVPILGRMSDSDDDIRSTATNTFASLVKMVPLEVRLSVSFRIVE